MNALRVCPGVLHRAHPLQAVMGAEVVVVLQPTLGYLPDLVQRVEQVRIQHMLPEGAVEALNEGILRRLARLDVDELNALHPAPLLRQRGNELRPVVHPDALWLLPSPYQVIQHPHHPIALQGEVHLDVQGLPVIVVHHVKRAEFPSVGQGIAHKVNRPGVVRLLRHLQRLLYPLGQPLLGFPPDTQPDVLVDPVHPLMVPGLAFPAQPVVGFPEALPRVLLGLLPQRRFHGRVVLFALVVVDALAQFEHTARPADAYLRQRGHFLSYLSLLAGR